MNSAGISGQKSANSEEDVLAEEHGEWHYIVIDPSGMRAREDASYTKDTKKQDKSFRFVEGTVVKIDRRRTAGWTKWLALKSGEGWLFDVSPKDKKVRLMEVEVASGPWPYHCMTERVPILQKPLQSLMAKSAKGPALTIREAV